VTWYEHARAAALDGASRASLPVSTLENPAAVRLALAVPIPPDLVRLLRAHIKRYGTTPDGRIFQTARGGIQDSAYSTVWAGARKKALTPAQCGSPLGRRLCDLRHAAVSLWLNSGVPATEVARRAGHGVAVLLKIYAHCIDGQADAANQRITDALGIQDTQPESEPGDEREDDSEQAS
jgi:integrase